MPWQGVCGPSTIFKMLLLSHFLSDFDSDWVYLTGLGIGFKTSTQHFEIRIYTKSRNPSWFVIVLSGRAKLTSQNFHTLSEFSNFTSFLDYNYENLFISHKKYSHFVSNFNFI